MKTKKIGLIGLGAMGSKLAERLMSQGYEVGVFNRTADKAELLKAKGAWVAQTPKELAEKSDVMMLSVTDDEAVREVTRGETGAFAGAKAGTVFLDCSTISVQGTREAYEEARHLGFHWLDTPVLGSPHTAEAGEMPFVVGGDKEILDQNREVLEAIGKKITYIGASGLGQAAKLVHNIVCGISLIAYSEALLLGEAMGLTRVQTLEVLKNGAVASTLLSIKIEKLEKNQFTPTAAPLINMRKDMGLAVEAATQGGLNLPALSITKRLNELAVEQGLGLEDTSSVLKALIEFSKKNPE